VLFQCGLFRIRQREILVLPFGSTPLQKALQEGVPLISQHTAYRFDSFLVDPVAWKLFRREREIHLEPTVLRLLVYLISNRDRLVSRQELMNTVWADTVVSDSALSKAVARVRKALGDDSSAPRYLETVHTQGYRFIAEVEEIELDEQPAPTSGSDRTPILRRSVLSAIAVGILLILLLLFWPDTPDQGRPQAGEIESLAVLPLANLTGDPEQDYFVEGLQEVLITELSRNSGLRVTSRQSTIRYRGSDKPMPNIAEELGVDALIEGSALRLGDQVEVALQLIYGRTDEHLWAQRYERDARYVFDMLSEAAATISVVTQPGPEEPVGTPMPSGQRMEPVDPEASQSYLRGLFHLNRFGPNSFQLAIEQLQKAIEIEPGFQPAWGSLAVAHLMLAYYGDAPPDQTVEKARLAAMKALELDESTFIGHAALGWIRLFVRDWPGACQSFQEALRLNPSHTLSLHGDADCLMLTGRMEESIAQVRKAQLLDPFTPMSNMPVAFHLFMMHRYDEAAAEALALRERIPGYSVHWLLGLVYWQQGLLDKALEEERKELEWRKENELLTALDEGRATGGPMGAMRAIAEALVLKSRTEYVDPFRIAAIYARAGEAEEALYWLERAVDRGSLELIYITVRPEFDPLRENQRFRDLVQRAGLLRVETD
jgi:TolB-like protein/DNA-binding winged helix-turn-helix (wHTH) protein/Flp pilus assembly protein TadD